jgi:hypothetical protein
LLSYLNAQGKLEWAQTFLDGSFVPAKKGTGIGKTKVEGLQSDSGFRWPRPADRLVR